MKLSEVVLPKDKLVFLENRGQWDDVAKFVARNGWMSAWFEKDAFTLQLEKPVAEEQMQSVVTRLTFVGASDACRLEGETKKRGTHNFLVGKNSEKWQSGIAGYEQIVYRGLYPGVDLELTSERGQYIQRLLVHPDADLSAVRLRVDGAEALALEPLPPAQPGPGDGEDVPDAEPSMSPSEPSNEKVYLRLTTELGEFSLPLLWLAAVDDAGLPMPTPPAARVASEGNVVEFPFLLVEVDELLPERQRSISPTPASAGEATDLLSEQRERSMAALMSRIINTLRIVGKGISATEEFFRTSLSVLGFEFDLKSFINQNS